jgi:hypothetical protein
MRTIKETINSIVETDEKEQWFHARTNKHINLVRKYCQRIFDYDRNRFRSLVKQGQKHDASKFKSPEFEPYVHVNWHYKMKRQGKEYKVSKEMQDAMHQATLHHIKNNPHHPEFHTSQVNVLNKDMKNRDEKVAELIDATKMPEDYVAEMVADWCAMSEELGSTPMEWGDKMINKKWKFTDKQVEVIKELIKAIWKQEDYAKNNNCW